MWLSQYMIVLPKLNVAGSIPVSRSNLFKVIDYFVLWGPWLRMRETFETP